MSDIAVLKEMIQESATLTLLEQENGKRLSYAIALTETQSEPENSYSVTINGMPKHDEVIIIKADAFPAPRAIFQGNKGECKRADFVIIANTNTEKVILCIEMKKKKGSNKTIIQQLTGAKCFVSYCQEIGKAFWQQQNFLDAYQYRFVSIGHISMSKKTTRFYSRKKRSDSSNSIHDRPEQMLKISSQNVLEFNYLIEG
jgi:hypothetical protein